MSAGVEEAVGAALGAETSADARLLLDSFVIDSEEGADALEAMLNKGGGTRGGADDYTLPIDWNISDEMLCDEKAECAICFDDLKDGEITLSACCGNWFHTGCIYAWKAENTMAGSKCPVCKRRLTYKTRQTPTRTECSSDFPLVLPMQVLRLETRYAEDDVWDKIKHIKKDLDHGNARFAKWTMRSALLDKWFDYHFKTMYLPMYDLFVQLLRKVCNPRLPSRALDRALNEMAATDYFRSITAEFQKPRAPSRARDFCYRQHRVSSCNWFLATSAAAILMFPGRNDIFLKPIWNESRHDVLSYCLLGWVRDVLKRVETLIYPNLSETQIRSKQNPEPTTIQKLIACHVPQVPPQIKYVQDVDTKYLILLAFLVIPERKALVWGWEYAEMFKDLRINGSRPYLTKETKSISVIVDKQSQYYRLVKGEGDCLAKDSFVRTRPAQPVIVEDLGGGTRGGGLEGTSALALVGLAVIATLFC